MTIPKDSDFLIWRIDSKNQLRKRLLESVIYLSNRLSESAKFGQIRIDSNFLIIFLTVWTHFFLNSQFQKRLKGLSVFFFLVFKLKSLFSQRWLHFGTWNFYCNLKLGNWSYIDSGTGYRVLCQTWF